MLASDSRRGGLASFAAVVLPDGGELDASDDINLGRIRSLADLGVDLISVGALTHSAPALDISLDLDIR
jgi:nicotinate-nucleotide pyrophosphorylase (carboxylating)